MTADEVCKVLRISKMTLYRRIKDGELTPLPKAPGLKRNRPLLFNKADIDKILQGS